VRFVSRKKGGFVLFSVVASSKGEEAKAVQKDELLAAIGGFELQALSVKWRAPSARHLKSD
jgi:hypothetical protein